MTAVTRLFERKHVTLKRIHEEGYALDPPLPSASRDKDPSPKPLTVTKEQQQARHARRKNRYDEVKALHEQGVSQRAIATLVGLHRDTVHRYLNTSEVPEIVRSHRRSKLDPYKDYLHQRWTEGVCNVTHLVAELRDQGYQGSDTIVCDYLRPCHEKPRKAGFID
jgi:transposase